MKKGIFAFVKAHAVNFCLLLLPLIYGFFYMIFFFYLENREVVNYRIIKMKLDTMIPFCEYFIIPYTMWFFYIAASVVIFAFLNKKDYLKLCITLGVGMTVFLVISYFIPNMQPLRPTYFARDNIFVDMVKKLYAADTCTNVFPSIHVYNSLVVTFAIHKNRQIKEHRFIVLFSDILCVSIGLSTMLLKQHSIFDVMTGTAMSAIMYWFVYVLPVSRTETEHELEKGLSH